MASIHFDKAKEIFHQYDKDGDDALSFNELTEALVDISHKITTLPAVRYHLDSWSLRGADD